jgi:uncharacterized protein with HEPN domain
MKDDRVYLLHIADAIGDIQNYVSDGKDTFYSNKMIQDAVIRNLEIIGEAVKNISAATRMSAHEVPWQKIAGLRDVLIHEYFGVDLDTIWLVVENRLPVLSWHISLLLKENRLLENK